MDYLFNESTMKSIADGIRKISNSSETIKPIDMADKYEQAIEDTAYVHPYHRDTNVFVSSFNGSDAKGGVVKAVFDEPWMLRTSNGHKKAIPYWLNYFIVTTNVTVPDNCAYTIVTSNQPIAYVTNTNKYCTMVATPSKTFCLNNSFYTVDIIDDKIVVSFDAVNTNYHNVDYDVIAVCHVMEDGGEPDFNVKLKTRINYAIEEEHMTNLYDSIRGENYDTPSNIPANQLGDFIVWCNRKFPFDNTNCMHGEYSSFTQSTQNESFQIQKYLSDGSGGLFRYTDDTSETSGDYKKCWERVYSLFVETEPSGAGANATLFSLSSEDGKPINAYGTMYINIKRNGTAAQVTLGTESPLNIVSGSCYLSVSYPACSLHYRNSTNYRLGSASGGFPDLYEAIVFGICRKERPLTFDFSGYDFNDNE